MGRNLRFWDPTQSAIRYASDFNNDNSSTLGIQEALNDLPDDGGAPHGKVIVDNFGEIFDTITVLGGQMLQGTPSWYGAGGAWANTIRLANGVNKDMIELKYDGVNEVTMYFATIIDLMLYGNKANNASGSCIKIQTGLKDVYLERVLTANAKEHGIHINNSNPKTWIDQCYAEFNDLSGIYLQAVPVCFIRQAVSAVNGEYGIRATVGRGRIVNSYIVTNGKDGILMQDAFQSATIANNLITGNGTAPGYVTASAIWLLGPQDVNVLGNTLGHVYGSVDTYTKYGVRFSDAKLRAINVLGNTFNKCATRPLHFDNTASLNEVEIGPNQGLDWYRDFINRFKDTWVGHSLDTTHKWRGQATGTGSLPAYTTAPSFETVLFDIAAAGAGTSVLDMNGQRPFDAQFNSYINGSYFIDDVSEADLYFGFYKDADEYAYFHVTAGDVYVKANDGGAHGPYSEDTTVNVGDAEIFYMMVELLRTNTPRFKLNGNVVGTPTVGSAPTTGVGADAYVHLANRNNSAIQGFLNPIEITSGRELW